MRGDELMASNKRNGSKFENDFAKMLAIEGFWARLDKSYSQTCDIIAGKNNVIYLFECKVCKSDYFNLSRVEDNQNYSRRRFRDTGNDNAWFVYKVDAIGEIYLSKEPILKPSNGIKLERWLKNEHNNK